MTLKRTPFGAKKRELSQTEAAFQKQVEDLAGYLGWTSFHVRLPQRSPAGFPDLVLFRERIIFAELKTRSPTTGRPGKLSPWQIDYAHTIFKAGGEYYSFLFPDDWEQVKEVLSRGGKITLDGYDERSGR